MESSESVLLMGRDHCLPGELVICTVGHQGETAASISVGGIHAIRRKEWSVVPNEDCVFAADFGRCAVHAVADGHRGHEASHEVIKRVAGMVTDVESVYAPLRNLEWLATPTGGPGASTARTTLTIAVIDREIGELSGLSIGDSPAFVLGGVDGQIAQITTPRQYYVSPFHAEPPQAVYVMRFTAELQSGDMVLSCSDGVTECHYGSPSTSVTLVDLKALAARIGATPRPFVTHLSRLALDGVRGMPGGEDNIGIVCSRL